MAGKSICPICSDDVGGGVGYILSLGLASMKCYGCGEKLDPPIFMRAFLLILSVGMVFLSYFKVGGSFFGLSFVVCSFVLLFMIGLSFDFNCIRRKGSRLAGICLNILLLALIMSIFLVDSCDC